MLCMQAMNKCRRPSFELVPCGLVLASAALGLILYADFLAENILVWHHEYVRPGSGPRLLRTRYIQSWAMNHEPCSLARHVCPWNCTIECMHLHTYVRARRHIIYRSIDHQIRHPPAATNRDWSIRFTMHAVCSHVLCATSVCHQTLYQPLNKKLLATASS
jgi:hypothetical protein